MSSFLSIPSTCFEQDLARLSCVMLGRARDLMLEHLIHTFPLRESHLKAIMIASVEMDLSELCRMDDGGLDVYLEKLRLVPSNVSVFNESRNANLTMSTPAAVPREERDSWDDGGFSITAIQQLRKRQLSVSCSSSAEAGLENIWKTLRQKVNEELPSTSNMDRQKHSAIGEDLPLESDYWSRWRARSLSYMLDKRTIRMISGANLICSAPEGHWTQVMERLNISEEYDDFCEMIELLLLGCVANRWSALLEHLMSVSHEFPAIPKLYHEVFSLPLAKPQGLFMNEGLMNDKEKRVVDYLEVLLCSKVDQLWKLPPILAAVAIPSWSKLFRSYLHELESQLVGNPSATRHCSCPAGPVEHRECEVAERIWCLYIFHIYGSNGGTRMSSIA